MRAAPAAACQPEELKKADKLAHFAPLCSQIMPGIFLGGLQPAHNMTLLKEVGITHVVNCVQSLAANAFPDQFAYLTLDLNGESDSIPQADRQPWRDNLSSHSMADSFWHHKGHFEGRASTQEQGSSLHMPVTGQALLTCSPFADHPAQDLLSIFSFLLLAP